MIGRVETLLKTVAAIALVFAAGCSGGNDYQARADNLQSSVNANWMQYKQEQGLPGGGMAVYIESPSGHFFASSGMGVGIDRNTRFRIASNTKTFTAAAVMLLEQQGKLNIDDTIVSLIPGKAVPYVPETDNYNVPNKQSITIRQLLSHTAGVFDVTNDDIPTTCAVPYAGRNYLEYRLETDPSYQFSPDELVGIDAACRLSYFLPGTSYKYSNTGYSILAKIIERVSDMTYDQFVILNLIQPNGLSSTSVPMLGTDRMIPTPFNPGYLYENGIMTDVTQSNMSGNIAEGNIISTPADLATWVRRLIRGEAGPNAAAIEKMKTMTPQSGNKYGLGILYAEGLGYGHNGAHEGYLSLMVYDPSVDVTTILYFNVWDVPNLFTKQFPLLTKAAKDARAAVGY